MNRSLVALEALRQAMTMTEPLTSLTRHSLASAGGSTAWNSAVQFS